MNLTLQEKPPSFLYETPLLHQSSFWSQVKRNQGFKPLAYDIKARSSDILGLPGSSFILDDILILLSPISCEHSIAYVPYGPVLSPLESQMGSFLEELSEQLRDRLPRNCVLLRYDLPWKRPWEEENLQRMLQELRLNWGTEKKLLRKSCTDQLPPDTIFIDIEGSESDILSRMHPKTRYNIRLALKKGVVVRKGTFEDLPLFYELYKETCVRNSLNLHDSSYFSSFFGVRGNEAGFSLFLAELDGVPLSAMFLTHSANRATYLFGASSSRNRNSMSTYALQWNAILQARIWGCTQYDMFGIAPSEQQSHPMHGLNTFKKGFGGTIFHRMGCWDYSFDEELTNELFAYEMVEPGYHRT
ncbi:peptidoglycan bridge formation glycyltransferase FemA/FemB family protein [uncultured Sphaerochaeta sp.]|uniref:lipid II:glycine glycyltransferase FemX n=1 Tax=uncultured Sphaerochaeta sp. TaxID=886478 RepID=UPI002A0A1D4D|nr:peptidoglycan bridge formation glycyltransferase FemA/FemB family protein [uncultured Sphaerochaeta sp.]